MKKVLQSGGQKLLKGSLLLPAWHLVHEEGLRCVAQVLI